MSAMINLSASKKTDTINLDVKPVTNVHIGDMSTSQENLHKKSSGVKTREIVMRTHMKALMIRLVLMIMMSY